MIFLANMPFWMSDLDDFGNDQIAWKLAQRYTLSLLCNFFSSLQTKMILKMPNETFLWITRYLADKLCHKAIRGATLMVHSTSLATFSTSYTLNQMHPRKQPRRLNFITSKRDSAQRNHNSMPWFGAWLFNQWSMSQTCLIHSFMTTVCRVKRA